MFSATDKISVGTYSEDLVEGWIQCLLFYRCFPFSEVSFVRNKVAFNIPLKAKQKTILMKQFYLHLKPALTDFFGLLGAAETSCEDNTNISSSFVLI